MSRNIITRISAIPPIQRQSMIQLGVTLTVTLFGFLSTMLFSHLLGSDLMGVYYLFLAYYGVFNGVFNMIGDAGFGGAAVKRISEGKDQNEYLTAYAVLRFLLIIVSTLILLAISPYFVDLKEYDLIPWIIAALAAAQRLPRHSLGTPLPTEFTALVTSASGILPQASMSLSASSFR